MKRDIQANRIALAAEEEVNGPVRKRVLDYLRGPVSLGRSRAAHRLLGRGGALFFSATPTTTSLDQLEFSRESRVFMDQHPVEPPTHVTGELYSTANVRTIQETFEQLLPRPTLL